MHTWLARGLLVTSVLSISVVAMASARAAAAVAAPGSLSGVNSAKGETALGNLAADALRLAAKADAALLPAGILEERELAPNANSPEAVRRVLAAPPTEAVVAVKVKGKGLKAALARSLSLFPRKNRGFLQVSGLTLTFDPEGPEADRILDVRVGGKALSAEETYLVAMPESLARGGLGYFNLWDEKDAKPVTDSKGAKVSLVDALVAHLKDGKTASASDKRIRVKS